MSGSRKGRYGVCKGKKEKGEKRKKKKCFFFFKQKTAYEIKECDWSSDVCSSDLLHVERTGEIDIAVLDRDQVISGAL